jgi:transposase-like protein
MAAYAPRKKKLEAIELLAAGGMSFVDVAETVGVTQKTLRQWRKEPEFGQMVLDSSRALIKENMPDIYNVLLSKAKKGDTQALKLWIEHSERLEQLANVAQQGHISFTWRSNDQ